VTVVRKIAFDSLEEKAAWLDSSASLDAGRDGVRALAARIVSEHGRDPRRLAESAFLYWRDGIRYERDVRLSDMERAEQFADPDAVMRRGFDDCDGKARGFVATIRAVAIEARTPALRARIVPIFSADWSDFKHVQAEVRWDGSNGYRHARPDGWLLAELTLAGVPLGAGVEAASRSATTGRLDVT
jgi:transglutaminase-like putative cysteine protease